MNLFETIIIGVILIIVGTLAKDWITSKFGPKKYNTI